MKKILKSIALDIFAKRNSILTSKTEKKVLLAFLNKLFPIKTNKELIRLGPKGDGGYLVPDCLDGIEACFSPGVSFVSGFEKDCANLGMKVFMADKSVDKPAESHELFHFTKKYIGLKTNEDFMTMDDWIKSSITSSNSDLLLQIDIEGYEYETFLGMSDDLLKRFRIIVAEFQWLDQLWVWPFFKYSSLAFEKILQTHTCVHIHPNNCCGSYKKWGLEIPYFAEFSFLRNDYVINPVYTKDFPHPLDCDNTDQPTLILPDSWYKK